MRQGTKMGRGAALAALALGAATLAGCQDKDIAEEGVSPPLAEIQETPGSWNDLAPAIGQTPTKSLVLSQGPLVTDLKALLGPDYQAYLSRMTAGAGPLERVGPLLVTTTAPDAPDGAYLVIDPRQHGMALGYSTPRGWVSQRTPGADFPLPPVVQSLVARLHP